MALYLGYDGVKKKIIMDGSTLRLCGFIKPSIVENIKLFSSDNYILKDSNGLYLIPKEDE